MTPNSSTDNDLGAGTSPAQPRQHATLKDGEYFLRIEHSDPRFGVEEHYPQSHADMLRFLTGAVCNARPNDTVTIVLPPNHQF